MSDSESSSNSSGHSDKNSDDANVFEKKLGKRLAYLLRYGAEKEGLRVSDKGYVDLMELLRVPILRFHKPYEVLKEVEESTTFGGNKRFEKKYENGSIYIRAVYGRRMERNPNHEGSKVPRLMEICLNTICDKIQHYDLQDLPDEFLINTIIHRLKRTHRLNNKSFNSLLGPYIEHLDLGGVMITMHTIKLVGQRCPNLKEINLRESSYILNDHIMEMFLKNLPVLEILNLSGCCHLTDRTINAIIKNCRNMAKLNISHVPRITQEAVLKLVTTCPKLSHLDILDNRKITEEGKEILAEFCRQKSAMVVLDGLEVNHDVAKDDTTSLKLASVGKYW